MKSPVPLVLVPILLLSCAVVATAQGEADVAVGDPLERDVALYREAEDPKAFAVSTDENGMAWGFAWGADSAEDAMKTAFLYCAASATEQGVKAPCQIAMLGNNFVLDTGDSGDGEGSTEPVAERSVDRPVVREPANEAPSVEIEYGERYVEGQHFLLGTAGDLQVWASMFVQPLRAMVWVVNATDRSFVFRPSDLQVIAHKNGGSEVLETWGAEEYERKQRRKAQLMAGLYGAAAAINNQPQARTSTYSGTSNGSFNAWGTGPGGTAYGNGTYRGTYAGTITTWPTAQDYAEANARTQAQVSAMANQLESQVQAVASELLRPHTLDPGTTYGGVVYFEKEKAQGYTLKVSVGGERFEFRFKR